MKYEDIIILGEVIKIPLPESYCDCITLIKSDLYRINIKKISTFTLLFKYIFIYRSQNLFWFRLSQYKGFFYPFTNRIYNRICKKKCIDFPPNTKVGFGLYLGHNIAMVINSSTIIGNNVNLSHFLSIGANSGKAACIGDNVYIGPNVSVVENVMIGSNSSIGAGSVVVKDVPQNSTVAGVPAKVLNYNNPEKFIKNKFPFSKSN